jgi:hypothetical protein
MIDPIVDEQLESVWNWADAAENAKNPLSIAYMDACGLVTSTEMLDEATNSMAFDMRDYIGHKILKIIKGEGK